MANSWSTNPIVLDTASDGQEGSYVISSISYAGNTTVASTVELTNLGKTRSIFLAGTGANQNGFANAHFERGGLVVTDGLYVKTLGSGKVYIYTF